jgi:hypothetical protein
MLALRPLLAGHWRHRKEATEGIEIGVEMLAYLEAQVGTRA